jgi:membrane fusion protein, copper/silver efflux system
MNKRIVIGIAAIAVLALGGYGLYSVGMNRGMRMAAPAAAPDPGRKVLYWHDPMVPGQRFDKPGKSPFMDMDLVPVYADEADDKGGITISPRIQQNLGVRLAEATRREVAPVVEAVGVAAYNERDVAVVTARANGFVERLHVRAQLDPVRRGQPLAELYVPEWVAVQEEYLGVARMTDPGLQSLKEGALQRMRLAGMTDEQVKRVAAGDKVQPRFTLVSPIDGIVAELGTREGQTVMSGAPLFRINGLGTIWVNAEVPESLAAHVRPGNAVEAHAAAFPGKTFKGKVSAILPEVNAATRTLKARVELANPGGQLVPGMFATLNFAAASRRQAVMVPTEAVIVTGKRSVVMVAEAADEGKLRYRPVDVEIGVESDGFTEIRKGIEPGTKVVASGQFLIDSEASLKASTGRMSEAVHTADGVIESADAQSILLSHGPVPSLNWGPMTMEFKVRPGVPVAGLKEGSKIRFEFVQSGEDWVITGVTPSPTTTPSNALPQGGGKGGGSKK